MKIITGISNAHMAEEIEAYVNAGVDEFFLGYVPAEWSNEYGWELSNNRRETSNFQYHTKEELKNIVNLIHSQNRKVFLALNAHEYTIRQIKVLIAILEDIRDIIFDGFIVSNIGLILELQKNGFNTPLNISIGAASNNIETLKFFTHNFENIGRFVLPRKLSMNEIEKIASFASDNKISIEAFGMGGPYCVFNDEYCFTWHGAANSCFCQSPMYTHHNVQPLVYGDNWKKDIVTEDISTFYSKLSNTQSMIAKQRSQSLAKHPVESASSHEISILNLLSSLTICGLCAFQKFKEWGIEAVKLPLRGRYFKNNLFVIELSKKVIEEQNASPKFCKGLLNSPNFCSGKNCYYNYPYSS